ncbi:MAG: alpha/beta hydrolase family protein, partial [Terriglobales bacterium]
STGFGQKFRNLNVKDSGGGEVDDNAAAVEYLIHSGLADPHRIAIAGGSHGGTEVGYAVTKYPSLFAAGIDMYGVANRATYIAHTNRNSAYRWEIKMGGLPSQVPAVYRLADIIPDVPKIQCPLLVMWGRADPQVPPEESEQLIAALRKAGKTFEYHSYPGEGHGFRNPAHMRDAWQRELTFLHKYLGPGA